MPNALDVLLVVLFAVVAPLWSHFVEWPRHLAALKAGDVNARSRIYVRTTLLQWLIAAAAVALTLANGRSLGTLWLEPPVGWRAWVGFGLPAAYVALIVAQGRSIVSRPAALTRLRARLEPLAGLIPHTPAEYRRFVPLAVTAGVCEELLFRGYLVWVLQAALGLYPAVLLSMVVFGLAHGYQGGKFGFRAALAGVGLGLLALLTGSVLPGMVFHAAIDLGSGWITYMAMSRGAEPVRGPGVATA